MQEMMYIPYFYLSSILNVIFVAEIILQGYNPTIMAENLSPVKEEKKVYTYQDLIKFNNLDIYSGFGEVKDSTKASAPHFSFGSSKRAVAPKKFVSEEFAKLDCIGKDTPKGPNYDVADKFSYTKGPQWKIGTTARNTLDTKAKYDHYFRKDVDLDINESDRSRRYFLGNNRFSGDVRFPSELKKYKMTPGPEYLPNLRPEIPIQPKFSLYARRAVKGFDPLIELNSTTEIVGPASYRPQNCGLTSVNENRPHWSIPKGPRDPTHKNRWQLNQTYDLTSAVGEQKRSDKVSKPIYSFSRQARGEVKKGSFSSHMEYKSPSVRIEHPRF